MVGICLGAACSLECDSDCALALDRNLLLEMEAPALAYESVARYPDIPGVQHTGLGLIAVLGRKCRSSFARDTLSAHLA